MFVVLIGSVLTTIFSFKDPGDWFGWAMSAWLWLTVIFANLAEAVAEGRGEAEPTPCARRPTRWPVGSPGIARPRRRSPVPSCASVTSRSSARRATSSPATASSRVWRASTSRRSRVSRPRSSASPAVTAVPSPAAKVLSDRIVIKITTKPGETFIDRMIALVGGGQRRRTRSR